MLNKLILFPLFAFSLSVSVSAQENRYAIKHENVIFFFAQLNDFILNPEIGNPFDLNKEEPLRLAFEAIQQFNTKPDQSPFLPSHNLSQVIVTLKVYEKCLVYSYQTPLEGLEKSFFNEDYFRVFKQFAFQYSQSLVKRGNNSIEDLFDFCQLALLTKNETEALTLLQSDELWHSKGKNFKAAVVLALYSMLSPNQAADWDKVANLIIESITQPADLELEYRDKTVRSVVWECILGTSASNRDKLVSTLLKVWQNDLKKQRPSYIDDLVFLFNNGLMVEFCLSEFVRLLEADPNDSCSAELVSRIGDNSMPVPKNVAGLVFKNNSEVERLIGALQTKELLQEWTRNGEKKWGFEVITQLALASNSFQVMQRIFDQFINVILNDQEFKYLSFGQANSALAMAHRTFFDRLLQLGSDPTRNAYNVVAQRVEQAMRNDKFCVDDALRFAFLADKYQTPGDKSIVDLMIDAIIGKTTKPLNYLVFTKTNLWLTDLSQYASKSNVQAIKSFNLLNFYFFIRNRNRQFAYVHVPLKENYDALIAVTDKICNASELKARCLLQFTRRIRDTLADSLDSKTLENESVKKLVDERTKQWFSFVESKTDSIPLLEAIVDEANGQEREFTILIASYWIGTRQLLLDLTFKDNPDQNRFEDKANRIKQIVKFVKNCRKSKMKADVVAAVIIYLPNQNILSINKSSIQLGSTITSLDPSKENAFYNLRNTYFEETKDLPADSAHLWGLAEIALSSRNPELCGNSFKLFMNKYKGRDKLDRLVNFVFSMPDEVFWDNISICMDNLSKVVESSTVSSASVSSQEKIGCPQGPSFKDLSGNIRLCFSFDDLKDIRRLGPAPLNPINLLRIKARMEEALNEIKLKRVNRSEVTQRSNYLSEVWRVFISYLALSERETQRFSQKKSLTIPEESYLGEHEAAIAAFFLIWAPHNLSLNLWDKTFTGEYARGFFRARALKLVKMSSAEISKIKLRPEQIGDIFDYDKRVVLKFDFKNLGKFPEKFLAQEFSFLLRIGASQTDGSFVSNLLIPVFSDNFRNKDRLSKYFERSSPQSAALTVREIYSDNIPSEHAKFSIQNLSNQRSVGRWVCYAIVNQTLERQRESLEGIDQDGLLKRWKLNGDLSLRVLATWFSPDWQLFAELLQKPPSKSNSALLGIVYNHLDISDATASDRSRVVELKPGDICGIKTLLTPSKVTKCALLSYYLEKCLKSKPHFPDTLEVDDENKSFFVFKIVSSDEKYKTGDAILNKCH